MKPASKLIINTRTWSRDSYSLFDYESMIVSQQQYITSQSCSILRISNEVDFLQASQEVCFHQPESRIIAKIDSSSGLFSVKSGQDDDLWKVISSSDLGYELQPNDIIKLGRIKLQIKRIRTKSTPLLTFQELRSDHTGICRICFSEDSSEENPLITPCKCIGSMQHIHLSCLQTWINSKCNKITAGSSISYHWKNIDCEICQHQFPQIVNFVGPNAYLSKIERSEEPYIILESLEKDKSNSRGLYLIQFNSEVSFKLGRGHDSDVKFNDISVSRFHASLTYKAGKFFLKDNKSKFGTLVQIPNNFCIEKSLLLQAGRTLVCLKVLDEEDSMQMEEIVSYN